MICLFGRLLHDPKVTFAGLGFRYMHDGALWSLRWVSWTHRKRIRVDHRSVFGVARLDVCIDKPRDPLVMEVDDRSFVSSLVILISKYMWSALNIVSAVAL